MKSPQSASRQRRGRVDDDVVEVGADRPRREPSIPAKMTVCAKPCCRDARTAHDESHIPRMLEPEVVEYCRAQTAQAGSARQILKELAGAHRANDDAHLVLAAEH